MPAPLPSHDEHGDDHHEEPQDDRVTIEGDASPPRAQGPVRR